MSWDLHAGHFRSAVQADAVSGMNLINRTRTLNGVPIYRYFQACIEYTIIHVHGPFGNP